jgi:tartrate-resistant acid phosphatase type 5
LAGLAAGASVATLSHALAAPSRSSVNFLVVGDWGRDGAQHQRDVAIRMGEAAKARDVQYVVSVGDNFYEDGVRSVTDPQWRFSFETIYDAPSLQVPWYVALGNHDYRGVPQAQIDYSGHSTRWRMPSRYFKVSGKDLGAPHVDMFVIDTSPLVHKYRENVHTTIAENVSSQDVQAQLKWLDEALAASSAPWKLVVGHHTIYSGGSGHGDTPELGTLVDPLLRKHGVQAYINGHDHDLQHIRRSGVDYLCCGAGSEVRPVQPIEGTLFCLSRSGFAVMTSSATALDLEFHDYTGATVYQATIPVGHRDLKAA